LDDEAFGWVFVNAVPLLYDKKRVARQLKVEMWLDLAQAVKELGIEKLQTKQNFGQMGYIV